MTTNCEVMLVDSDRLFCAALAALLETTAFRISAEFPTLADANNAVRQGRRPDLILLNLQSGNAEELGQLKLLRTSSAQARIVVLASELTSQILSGALQSGADGCLNKTMSCEALQRSLHLVMLGEAVFPRSIADLLISNALEDVALPSSAAMPPIGNELSKREIEILRCLLGGQSNKAIARNLNITESTVKMHFKNVMRKIRAQNRTQAAVWAIQHGISPRLSA
ncbi:response regulator transcription factor [Skermanella mucosa]|uniref:LuxR C-terminal-related transcriptional regulator n=1 Tax=Skermanella mucosa TaxID=1789672 RepID=UPI00192C6070|nr:response regulator transcription factor [Skermanella mucosa]UEM23546.1 response regulator transcription factor [Skermanella mucosa]